MALHREARFHGLYSAAETSLRTALAKAERIVQAIGRDTEGAVRSKERQLWAELLLSQPNVQQKGVEQLEAQNWDGEVMTIRLNPALSLRENADEYFKKASTARETLKKREARREQQERLVRRFTEALLELRSIRTEKDLEKFMTTFSKNAKNNATHDSPQSAQRQGEKQQGGKHQKTTRFREFPLDDDHTLYVGKTAADNDELTLRFAKPQDYWFHARGVPGSHAILRAPSKDKKPPKHVLEQAASIAAYFSKARNAKMSPVAYTQKKYVRKPKGAAVGAVILEREEVVMVRPHVPAGLLGTETDE
jgi:predicted ribosome quality control (RQC) complex YloA/Tae2 family protein